MREGNAQTRAGDEQPPDSEAAGQRSGTPSDGLPARASNDASNDTRADASNATDSAGATLREHAATLWRVLRGMGVSAEDVNRATAACFDRAARASDDTLAGVPLPLELERVIDPLLACAYREAQAQWRPALHTPAAPPTSSTVRFHAELLALELLAELDETKRACLLLADMESFSSPEIAALTGLRLDVVYEELRRARKALARALARQNNATASDPQAHARQWLVQARARFSPGPAELSALCDELQAKAWLRRRCGLMG